MSLSLLFASPYRERIQRGLPTLFNMVEAESRRGDKLGMEVGVARERVLIALFMHTFGVEAVKLPSSITRELDAYVNGTPVSIKTVTGASGVKLIWTVDWIQVKRFYDEYNPSCDILFVNIDWKTGVGGFHLIPVASQQDILKQHGKEFYIKLPKQGTNPRGVEISKAALEALKHHPQTLSLPIEWKRDPMLLTEQAVYGRWIDLWNEL